MKKTSRPGNNGTGRHGSARENNLRGPARGKNTAKRGKSKPRSGKNKNDYFVTNRFPEFFELQ
jgi:hypothetical protein